MRAKMRFLRMREVYAVLLEFRTKNYKSFADEMVFSMTPAPKQKGLDYSVLVKEASGSSR